MLVLSDHGCVFCASLEQSISCLSLQCVTGSGLGAGGVDIDAGGWGDGFSWARGAGGGERGGGGVYVATIAVGGFAGGVIGIAVTLGGGRVKVIGSWGGGGPAVGGHILRW